MIDFPIFDSKFLTGIASSLKKRSKSIKHNTRNYNLQKVIEKDGSAEHEKLEIDIGVGVSDASIRVYFWWDRMVWIDVRVASKRGWNFEWQNEGRKGDAKGQLIVNAIEKTIELSIAPSKESRHLFDNVWQNIVLKGPFDTTSVTNN